LPQWELRHPNVEKIEIGDDEVQTTLIRELSISMVAILFMMYGLLAIAFKSYAQPLLIMIAIPFAFIGMIFGNLVTGVPFGMMRSLRACGQARSKNHWDRIMIRI